MCSWKRAARICANTYPGCRVTPGKSNRRWKRDKSASLPRDATRPGVAQHDARVPGVARSRIQTDLRVNQNSNLVPGLEEIPNFVSPCPPSLSSKRRRRVRRRRRRRRRKTRRRKARLRPRLRLCDPTFPFASNFVLNCELLLLHHHYCCYRCYHY